MFRRVMSPATAMTVGTMMSLTQQRTFFGKGWDNAAVETIYRGILRRETVASELTKWVVNITDPRTLDHIRKKADAASKMQQKLGIFLPVHMGDPHRVLKAYALTAYPILDENGNQSCIHVEDKEIPLFADPDDDYSKVVLPNLELVKMLAEELLKTLNWEVSPRGAASLMEAMYRGAEVPDAVFESPKILDSINELTKQVGIKQ